MPSHNPEHDRGLPPSILVTGAPRSGTTWLARLLATAPGTALAGREPMNPSRGQYSLGRTLTGWTRLQDPVPKQRRALRRAYRGVNPLLYGRYGRRQWAAPWPWTRLIVKDPFALLSIPAVERVTSARPVVVFRHPGAVLASYRRMGWTPDLDDLRPILRRHLRQKGGGSHANPGLGHARTAAAAMGRFWAGLHGVVLDDLAATNPLIVSHEELAKAGEDGSARLFRELGLAWSDDTASEFQVDSVASKEDASTLHNFDRDPAAVADAWRSKLSHDEIKEIERITAPVHTHLQDVRLDLSQPAAGK